MLLEQPIQCGRSCTCHRALSEAGPMKDLIYYTRSSIAVVVSLALALSAPTAAQPLAKSEAENLVPPGGAAFDIPIHAGEVCILSFPGEKLVDSTALISSADLA